ncbi:hypothetical protein BZG36_02251 [Bifiguratus adelaidae]|uniref:Alpha-1,3-glucosyltransferase n=1 Tax=Bifiguratus adelaidae TaxID=1938954 RepID=A0A261Y1N8_9FUNG|nr:hypothetical protein BZG36_02251 [Bifiguratus adelaidae]
MESVVVVSTCIKALLFPAYRSTDFEVHRNWLAITHNLPLKEWYYEKTSQWTLDYPPFFAYFEYIISRFAMLLGLDERILELTEAGYSSDTTVWFQRSSVILSELVLVLATWRWYKAADSTVSRQQQLIIAASLIMHPGLLIVDHIHFQYNGFMYGIMLLSIVEAKKGRLLISGVIFAILLNFKHIYLYIAPAYFFYLLRAYCFETKNGHPSSFSIRRLVVLGASVVAVFALSLGPFVYMGQLPQVFARLFPFTRGLCHAYWAPNFWALWAGLDRALIIVAKKYGWTGLNEAALGAMTRGFVGDTEFAVLPSIAPMTTLILTILAQTASLVFPRLWQRPTFDNFLASLTLCGFASFLFGWHVHEKAILLILIPISLLATKSQASLRLFSILSIVGCYSLFPLLFTLPEYPIKSLVLALWTLVILPMLAHSMNTTVTAVLTTLDKIYLAGLIPVHLYTSIGHYLLFGTHRLEFLPLMIISYYTAIGVCWGWIGMVHAYLSGQLESAITPKEKAY